MRLIKNGCWILINKRMSAFDQHYFGMLDFDQKGKKHVLAFDQHIFLTSRTLGAALLAPCTPPGHSPLPIHDLPRPPPSFFPFLHDYSQSESISVHGSFLFLKIRYSKTVQYFVPKFKLHL